MPLFNSLFKTEYICPICSVKFKATVCRQTKEIYCSDGCALKAIRV